MMELRSSRLLKKRKKKKNRQQLVAITRRLSMARRSPQSYPAQQQLHQ